MLTLSTLAQRQADFKARLFARRVKGARRTSSHARRCIVHNVKREPVPSQPNKLVCPECRSESQARCRQRVQVSTIERKTSVVVSIDQFSRKRLTTAPAPITKFFQFAA